LKCLHQLLNCLGITSVAELLELNCKKIHEEWRACLFNFDIDAAIDGFDAETLEQIGDIFHEASNYIKKVGVDDGPCLFEEMSNELQSKKESRSGSMGSECC
jgi:hypothetical protein